MPYSPLLDAAEIGKRLAALPEWQREGDAIAREVRFPSFAQAIAFVARVAVLAESADHHPDIDIRWRKVRLILTTHASGGLTARDLELAPAIDGIAAEFGAGDD